MHHYMAWNKKRLPLEEKNLTDQFLPIFTLEPRTEKASKLVVTHFYIYTHFIHK
jgi:hypothetical protein